MSEITKLYENAGIKKCSNNLKKYKSDACLLNSNIYGRTCNDCMWYHNPPFTAEKQIELIKWLARKGLLQINYSSHQCYQFNSFRVGGDYKTDISEALASHCNNLWQDLIEEEKQQVKGILE